MSFLNIQLYNGDTCYLKTSQGIDSKEKIKFLSPSFKSIYSAFSILCLLSQLPAECLCHCLALHPLALCLKRRHSGSGFLPGYCEGRL